MNSKSLKANSEKPDELLPLDQILAEFSYEDLKMLMTARSCIKNLLFLLSKLPISNSGVKKIVTQSTEEAKEFLMVMGIHIEGRNK